MVCSERACASGVRGYVSGQDTRFSRYVATLDCFSEAQPSSRTRACPCACDTADRLMPGTQRTRTTHGSAQLPSACHAASSNSDFQVPRAFCSKYTSFITPAFRPIETSYKAPRVASPLPSLPPLPANGGVSSATTTVIVGSERWKRSRRIEMNTKRKSGFLRGFGLADTLCLSRAFMKGGGAPA